MTEQLHDVTVIVASVEKNPDEDDSYYAVSRAFKFDVEDVEVFIKTCNEIAMHGCNLRVELPTSQLRGAYYDEVT